MFKITIEEETAKKMVVPKKWEQVDTKEVEREPRFTNSPDEPKTRTTAVFGYTPEVETYANWKRTVLVQEVDDLDLVAVIRAINEIK